tara:strand:+ start:6248 stop:7147 length:900 start_codon:yes stop_codon:yes gene_type:complete
MRVKYEHGGPHDPVKDILSNQVHMLPAAEVVGDFVPRDEDEAKIYRNLGVQGVMDLRGMKGAVREGRDQFARDYMYPALEAAMALETGKGIIDVARLGAKGVSALLKNPRVMAKLMGRNADEVVEQAGGMKLIKTSDRAAKKIADKGARGVQEAQNRIQNDRLQYVADRLLNDAKTADMVDNLNLQGQLTDILEATIKGEKDKVNKLLMNITDDAANRRMVSDEINALAESVSGRSGGIVDEFRNVPASKLDEFMGRTGSMTEYLANPAKFDRVAGYNRLPFDITKAASRNEYGGIVKK